MGLRDMEMVTFVQHPVWIAGSISGVGKLCLDHEDIVEIMLSGDSGLADVLVDMRSPGGWPWSGGC